MGSVFGLGEDGGRERDGLTPLTTGDGRQETEDRRRETGDGRQETEDRRRKTEEGRRKDSKNHNVSNAVNLQK